MSHALKRLRKLFDDELLLRDGRWMRPTVRAGKSVCASIGAASRLGVGRQLDPDPGRRVLDVVQEGWYERGDEVRCSHREVRNDGSYNAANAELRGPPVDRALPANA